MDTAIQHWKILKKVPEELANKVREFMVIGEKGDGVMLLTDSGDGYWLGEMRFGNKSKQAIEPTPLNVPNLASMAQGYRHILMLDESGQIHAMGENNQGQLGLGIAIQQTHFSPQLISIPDKFTSVRCGGWHSLALTKDGKVWAWGGNYWGQVGVARSTANPQPSLRKILELDPHRVIAVECGGAHSLALTDQGEVFGWGWNDWGQFGDGSDTSTHILTQIPIHSPVKSMAAGSCHTLLLIHTGEVYACGWNEHGQLGLTTNIRSSSSLVKVAGLPPISQIASHFHTSLSIAMSENQQCFAWGYLDNKPSTSIPLQLSPIYSTPDSVLSFRSNRCYTPYSIYVKGSQKTDPKTETESITRPFRLEKPIVPMFDNPDSNPDVKFELGDQFILAHRSVLQISSAYFAQLFSSSSNSFNPPAPIPQSSLNLLRHTTNPSEPNPLWHTTNPSEPNPLWHTTNPSEPNPLWHTTNPSEPNPLWHTTNPSEPNPLWHTTNPSEPNPLWHTTNPSEPNPQITPTSSQSKTPLIIIPISDHSYPTFHAYLSFLYTDMLEVLAENLPELFDLARSHLESDLEQLCLARMRSTVSLENCCLYYQITVQHSLPEFQQYLVQFIANNIPQAFLTDAYRSLDGDLCKKLAISIGNFLH